MSIESVIANASKWHVESGDCRDGLARIPDKSVQMICTSPPYMGLRRYGDDAHEIGREGGPDEYVASIVQVFQQLRRVLRDDGTIWLNLNDTWAANRAYNVASTKGGPKHSAAQARSGAMRVPPGLKAKDLIGIPWRVMFALQGFATIQIDTIAALCKSIDARDFPALDAFRAGFRLWEELAGMGWFWNRGDIIWSKKNGMPERVRDRPTRQHEYLFLITKSDHYFYDFAAIAEPVASDDLSNEDDLLFDADENREDDDAIVARNARSVWAFSSEQYDGAHCAVFPTDLPRRCILAGTSDAGCCPTCGTAWVRVVERGTTGTTPEEVMHSAPTITTNGWKQSCACPPQDPVACIVLDPFSGAATTGLVALQHKRRYLGCEINPEYIDLTRKRLGVFEANTTSPLTVKATDSGPLFG